MFVKQLILPALALGLVQGAVLTRYVRSAVLDVQQEDYLRTARAKGLLARWRRCGGTGCATRRSPWSPCWRSSWPPCSSARSWSSGSSSCPGLGSLLLDARRAAGPQAWSRTSSWSSSSPSCVVNFVVELLYVAIDPRLRVGQR